MNCLACLSLADAAAYQAAVDASLGLPRPGLDCPGGIHQPGGGVTTHYGVALKHPTLTTGVFYPMDGTVQAKAIATPIGSAVQVFDPATWLPASPQVVG
jgi:hypothetical protein